MATRARRRGGAPLDGLGGPYGWAPRVHSRVLFFLISINDGEHKITSENVLFTEALPLSRIKNRLRYLI